MKQLAADSVRFIHYAGQISSRGYLYTFSKNDVSSKTLLCFRVRVTGLGLAEIRFRSSVVETFRGLRLSIFLQ